MLPTLDETQREKLSLNRDFAAGTRILLGRAPELQCTNLAVVIAVGSIVFCLYTLWVQICGCNNLYLVFYLVLKESCASMLILGTMSFVTWRTGRRLVTFLIDKSRRYFCPEMIQTIDEMGHLYTHILIFMGRNSSNLVRMFDLALMIKNRQLNQSRKDFDAILLSVSNMCFSLFIMYSSDQDDAEDRSLLLTIAMSLFSLMFSLCTEKAILQHHFDALSDINRNKLNKFELLLYLTKLQEDFLYEPVNEDFIKTLTDTSPIQIRQIQRSQEAESIADLVSKHSWIDYARLIIKDERKSARRQLGIEHSHAHKPKSEKEV